MTFIGTDNLAEVDGSGGYLVPRRAMPGLLLAMGMLRGYERACARRSRPTGWAKRNLRALRGVRRVNGRMSR